MTKVSIGMASMPRSRAMLVAVGNRMTEFGFESSLLRTALKSSGFSPTTVSVLGATSEISRAVFLACLTSEGCCKTTIWV
jgi:hypothetical protein